MADCSLEVLKTLVLTTEPDTTRALHDTSQASKPEIQTFMDLLAGFLRWYDEHA